MATKTGHALSVTHNTTFGRFVTSTVNTLENLLWPVQCAGCGCWDTQLCKDCRAVVDEDPLRLILEDEQGVPAFPLVALGEYDGTLRDIIVTAKHDPRRDMSGVLNAMGQNLGQACWPFLRDLSTNKNGRVFAKHFRRIWVVPAPSSHKRRRQRMEVVPDIAVGVSHSLSECVAGSLGPPLRVRVVQGVRLVGRASGMSGKSARNRGTGRTGTMRLSGGVPPGTLIVVVDDVSTTGATLRELVRTLGHSVFLCAVVAAAP